MSISIEFRPIEKDDIDDIKILCEECFPVRYPETWFKSLSSQKYFSRVAIDNGTIIGMIVARPKFQSQCNPEDINILNQAYFIDHKLFYILSLCVTKSYRKRGIASELFNLLSESIAKDTTKSIKAIFLHVLTTNDDAIRFYNRLGFQKCEYLPDYYTISDDLYPAYSYVLYINGGGPPRSVWSILNDIVKEMFLSVTNLLNRFYQNLWQNTTNYIDIYSCHKIECNNSHFVKNYESLNCKVDSEQNVCSNSIKYVNCIDQKDCFENNDGDNNNNMTTDFNSIHIKEQHMKQNNFSSTTRLKGYESSPLKLK